MSKTSIKVSVVGDASGLEKTFADVDEKAGKLGSSFGGLATKLAGVFAGVQVGQFFKGAVDAASDLNESMSKTDVVFGDSASAVHAFAKTAATDLGMSKQQAEEAANTFGNLFVAMHIGKQPAADMSEKLTQLASDLASFNNADPTEVLLALRSGLMGEAEPLRKFGVSLSAARIEAKAMEMGLAANKDELTAGMKTQAAYAIIMDDTSVAQGDYARTADGLANTQRTLSAQWKDMQATIGAQLLPTVQRLMGTFQDAMPLIGNLAAEVGNVAVKMVDVAASTGPAGAQFATVAAGTLATAAGMSKVAEKVSGLLPLLAQLATPTGAITALAAVVGGVLVNEFIKGKQEAQEAAARTDDLAEALRNAKDPTQAEADKIAELVDQMKGVKKGTDDTKQGVEDFTASWAANQAQADGSIEAFNKLNIGSARMIEATAAGGRVFGDVAQHMGESTDQFRKRLEGGTEAQRALITELNNARDSGRITNQQYFGMLTTLDHLSGAYDDNRERIFQNSKTAVDLALANGKVDQSFIDTAAAAAGATTEHDRYLAAAKALAKLQAGEAPTAAYEQARAIVEAGKAVVETKQSTEDLEKAEKELQKAHDELTKAYQDSAPTQLDYEGAVNKVADAMHDQMQKTSDLDVAIRDHGATSEEARVAQLALRDQTLDTKDSFLNQADAAVKVAENQAAMTGTTLDANAKTAIQRDELTKLAGTLGEGSPLRVWLDAYIAQLSNIPPAKHTEVVATYTTYHDEIYRSVNPDGTVSRVSASGGAIGSSGWTTVGERGPETVWLPKGASVTSNHTGGGGGDGGTVNIYATTNASADDIARSLMWARRTAGV